MNKHYNPRIKTAGIHAAIHQIFEDFEPRLTVRQIYYTLPVRGNVPNTEIGYSQLCNKLKSVRECSIFLHSLMVDNTRYHIALGVCPR